jgi:hypothetical protein
MKQSADLEAVLERADDDLLSEVYRAVRHSAWATAGKVQDAILNAIAEARAKGEDIEDDGRQVRGRPRRHDPGTRGGFHQSDCEHRGRGCNARRAGGGHGRAHRQH